FGGGWTVQTWNAATGRPGHDNSAHVSAVAALAVSPDGKQLASAGADLCVWNTANERAVFKVHDDQHALDAVSFTADGNEIVTRNAITRFCRRDEGTGKLRSRRRGGDTGTAATYFPVTDRLLVTVTVPPAIEIRNWQNEEAIMELEWPLGPPAGPPAAPLA